MLLDSGFEFSYLIATVTVSNYLGGGRGPIQGVVGRVS
jgi:hypothetical protein